MRITRVDDFGVNYQRAYKAVSSRTICMMPDSSGLQECKTGAFSGPEDDNKALVILEIRQRFANFFCSIGRLRFSLALLEIMRKMCLVLTYPFSY